MLVFLFFGSVLKGLIILAHFESIRSEILQLLCHTRQYTLYIMIKQPALDAPSPNFQFLTQTHSKHLNCKQCSHLMQQPIRLHRCGHTLCQACVMGKQIKQCPLCLQKIEAKQKDLLASRLVGELVVRCLNQGCPWRGSYEEFRSFHGKGCGLKEGGIDAWLKELQTVIGTNSKGNDKNQGDENQEQNIVKNSQLPKDRDQKTNQTPQNEPIFQKKLKKMQE